MKKALLVLLLLAVLAGGLFAQVSFGGEVVTGVLFKATDDDTTLSALWPDGAPAYRARLNGAYTNDDGNAGANFRVQLTDGGATAGYGWGWFKPLDMLTINFGKLDQWNYGSMGGFDSNNGFADPLGILVNLAPIPGLNVLLAGNLKNITDAAEPAEADYSAGVRYVAAGLFGANASINYQKDTKATAYAGFDFLGLSGLGLTKLAIDVKAENLNEFSDKGTFGVGPRIHFALGDLGLQLRSQVYLPLGGDEEKDLDLVAHLLATYKIGNITPGIALGYQLDGAAFSNDYRNWDAMQGKEIGGLGDPALFIKPYVAFNLGGKTVELGYAFESIMADTAITQHLIFANLNVGF